MKADIFFGFATKNFDLKDKILNNNNNKTK